MDLSTILNKIHNNDYVDVQQIRDDLFLTADNAVQFNGEYLFYESLLYWLVLLCFCMIFRAQHLHFGDCGENSQNAFPNLS